MKSKEPKFQEGTTRTVEVDYEAEIVTIQNKDSVDINMTGWKLVSLTGNQTFTFPDGFILKAGYTILITSGKGATAGDGKLKWTTANVHNNDKEDPAELYNMNEELVSSYSS